MLDLDHLYGSGPFANPHLYDTTSDNTNVLTAGFNELSDQAVPCNKMTISAFKIGTDGSLDALPGFGTADDDPGIPVGLAPGSQGIVAI